MKTLISLLSIFSLARAVSAVELVCESPVTTIIPGLPTVVRIVYVNDQNQTLHVPRLIDPYMLTVFPSWRSDAQRAYRPTVDEFFYRTQEESLSPAMIPLKSGNRLSQLYFVRTPDAVKAGEIWNLTISIRLHKLPEFVDTRFQPSRELLGNMTTQVEFKVAEVEHVSRHLSLDATKIQAFLSYESGKQNLGRMLERNELSNMVAAHKRGSPVGSLMMFGRNLTNGHDPWEHWSALIDARPEYRLLRNYLFLVHYTTYARTKLSRDLATKLSADIGSDEPLAKELQQVFASAR